MNTALIMKSTIGALTVAVVASGMAFISAPASAGTKLNTNIHVSKSSLKAKCDNSGGSFSESGTNYGCVVDNKKVRTVVNCTKQENCTGITTTQRRIFLKYGYMSKYTSKKWSAGFAKR